MRVLRKIKRLLFKTKKANNTNVKAFRHLGENTYLPSDLIIAGHENISIGDHVSFGPRCLIYSTKTTLTIGNHIMFGPEVMIITGDHRFDIPDKLMDEVTDDMKLPENDLPVTIEDDCWIGARVTILKGVTIGTGSIVAAGAVVLKNVPPKSIYYSKNDIRPRFKSGN